MSSDWRVYPVTGTAGPVADGVALTYARRYGLFTLVRIAGNDLDVAPDLPLKGGLTKRAAGCRHVPLVCRPRADRLCRLPHPAGCGELPRPRPMAQGHWASA